MLWRFRVRLSVVVSFVCCYRFRAPSCVVTGLAAAKMRYVSIGIWCGSIFGFDFCLGSGTNFRTWKNRARIAIERETQTIGL
jgi:hypothetical protein